MKPIKTTLFITAAILFSMILGTLKAHGQVSSYTHSQKLECEIKYYRENKIVLGHLEQELLSNKSKASVSDKIHDIETAMIKAEIFEGRTTEPLSNEECQQHLMDAEMLRKGTNPSAGDEIQ